MGILDQVVGAVGGAKGGGVQALLLQQLIAMLSQPGALAKLTAAFQQQGLAGVLQSWLGTGANLPISADQVQQVLGSGTLGAMASKAGVAAPEAATVIAKLLPQVIDKISPSGQAPADNNIGSLLGAVGKLLG
jgi:uncharacterized protein YidB (DUF937 family)